MTSSMTTAQIVDVNIAEQGLGILDAMKAFETQFEEAKDAIEVLNIIERALPADFKWTNESLGALAKSLPHNVRQILDHAASDTNVVVDVFADGMTRFDAGQAGDSDRITGFIRVAGDLHPLNSPKPGEAGSIYGSRREWLMDFVGTVLTGTHPEHGDSFPLDKEYAHATVNQYKRLIREFIGDMKLKEFRALIDAMPDRPVEDDEHISPHKHRNRFSHLLPPPSPEDETPPPNPELDTSRRKALRPGESKTEEVWIKASPRKRRRRRAFSGRKIVTSSMPYGAIWLNPGPDSIEHEFTELVRSQPEVNTPEHDRMLKLDTLLRSSADAAARRQRLLSIAGYSLDELWGLRVEYLQTPTDDRKRRAFLRSALISMVATIRGFNVPLGTKAKKAKIATKSRRRIRNRRFA